MARYRATNLQKGILTERCLGVIVNCMWKANKLATWNTERQLGRGGQQT